MSKESYDIPAGTAAERIVDVASDLFYSQGYRATGINEVIAKSGVAKATFYSHFKTKDDLCKEYLKGSQHVMLQNVEAEIERASGAVDRFLAPFHAMQTLMKTSGFRGCAFMNIASEVPDCQSPLRKQGVQVYDSLACRLVTMAEELIASDPAQYARLDAKVLARDYLIILTGAVALSELYAAAWPIEQGEQTLRGLITGCSE